MESQILSVENELNQAIRTVDLKRARYEEKNNELNELISTIQDSFTEKNDLVEQIGLSKLFNKVNDDMLRIYSENDTLTTEIKEKNKTLRKLLKKQTEIDKEYYSIFSEIYIKNGLGGFSLEKIEKADSVVKVDGVRNNITMVAWLCALLSTKYSMNDDCTIYPIVFDSPNNADLDESNEKTIFNMIFDTYYPKSQIITSKVGFDANEYPEYEIKKVITLDNEENHMLNDLDYDSIIVKYESIL